MSTVAEKMTAIADKIRSLLGLTGTMGLDAMAANLATTQTATDTQANLIAQISTVLDGKAGGGDTTIPISVQHLGTEGEIIYIDGNGVEQTISPGFTGTIYALKGCVAIYPRGDSPGILPDVKLKDVYLFDKDNFGIVLIGNFGG